MVLTAGASFTVRCRTLGPHFFGGPTLYNDTPSSESQPGHRPICTHFLSSATMSDDKLTHSADRAIDATAEVGYSHSSTWAPSDAQHLYGTNMSRSL